MAGILVEAADPLLTAHPLYASLGKTGEARRAAYRDRIATAITQDVLTAIRTATNGGFALGSQRFQQQIAAMLRRRTWRGRPGRPRAPEREARQMERPI